MGPYVICSTTAYKHSPNDNATEREKLDVTFVTAVLSVTCGQIIVEMRIQLYRVGAVNSPPYRLNLSTCVQS